MMGENCVANTLEGGEIPFEEAQSRSIRGGEHFNHPYFNKGLTDSRCEVLKLVSYFGTPVLAVSMLPDIFAATVCGAGAFAGIALDIYQARRNSRLGEDFDRELIRGWR